MRDGEVQNISTIDIGVHPVYASGYVVLVGWVGLEEDESSWKLLSTANENAPVCFKRKLRWASGPVTRLKQNYDMLV